MIYPNHDLKTGRQIPHSYLIGWEYSTNDDFQDIVSIVENVDLVTEGLGYWFPRIESRVPHAGWLGVQCQWPAVGDEHLHEDATSRQIAEK